MNKIKWRVAQFLMLVSMAIFNLMSVSSEKISTDDTFVCGFPMVTKMQELMLGFTEMKIDIKFLKKKIVHLSKEVSYLRKANKDLREGHRRLNVSLKHLKSTCSGVMKTDESKYMYLTTQQWWIQRGRSYGYCTHPPSFSLNMNFKSYVFASLELSTLAPLSWAGMLQTLDRNHPLPLKKIWICHQFWWQETWPHSHMSEY